MKVQAGVFVIRDRRQQGSRSLAFEQAIVKLRDFHTRLIHQLNGVDELKPVGPSSRRKCRDDGSGFRLRSRE